MSNMPMPAGSEEESAIDTGELEFPIEKPSEQRRKAPVENKPMLVMATRAGFYKQNRRSEGDKFTIDGPHHLGSWMKKI